MGASGILLERTLDLYEENLVKPRRSAIAGALKDILAAADDAGVRMTLVGALACGAYVPPRTTDDVDFLLATLDDVRRVVACAGDRFDCLDAPDVVTRIRHRATGIDVDLLVAEARFEHEAIRQARPRELRGLTVRVIPADHLAAMKVQAASDPRRDYDFGDARRLLLSGAAHTRKVSAMIRRDLPQCLGTLESLLRSVAAARRAPPPPARGSRRRG